MVAPRAQQPCTTAAEKDIVLAASLRSSSTTVRSRARAKAIPKTKT